MPPKSPRNPKVPKVCSRADRWFVAAWSPFFQPRGLFQLDAPPGDRIQSAPALDEFFTLLYLTAAFDVVCRGHRTMAALGRRPGRFFVEAAPLILSRSSADSITVHTPAKVNLFFEVLAKRDDGFHEIDTIMCPIDVYDTLLFHDDRSGRIQLTCERASGPLCSTSDSCRATDSGLPTGQDNLVVRAIELLQREAGVAGGASVRLIKRIPIASGLGGGSSDAAAALVAGNAVWRLGLDWGTLARLASRLGSDVPFFLAGGAAVCRGRGERIEPIAGLSGWHLVVARPSQGLSTAAVYRRCRPAERPRSHELLREAFDRGDVAGAGCRLFNRLQAPASALSPWIDEMAARFTRLDLPGHVMSGSGTSYFGLCRHAGHARRVARGLYASGIGSVFAARTCRN